MLLFSSVLNLNRFLFIIIALVGLEPCPEWDGPGVVTNGNHVSRNSSLTSPGFFGEL